MRLALTPMGAAVMGGRRVFGLSDILAILNGATNAVVTDANDFSTLSQTRYSWTPVTAAGQAVGLALNLSQGLELGAELKGTGAVGLTGTATAATYNTGTGAGTCVRVDVSNQSWVSIGSLNALYTYKAQITNTGAVELSIRTATSGGTVLATIAASATVDVYFYGNATCVVTASAAGTAAFTISTFQHIAGNHFRAPNDGTERPTLAELPDGSYGLQGDGTGDYMLSPSLDLTTTNDVTVYAGHRKLSDAAVGWLANHNSALNPSFALRAPASVGATFGVGVVGASTRAITSAASYAAPISVVQCLRYVDGSLNHLLINNDDPVTGLNAAVTAFANVPLYLFCRASIASFYNGILSRYVLIPSAVTDPQHEDMKSWINAKIGAY